MLWGRLGKCLHMVQTAGSWGMFSLSPVSYSQPFSLQLTQPERASTHTLLLAAPAPSHTPSRHQSYLCPVCSLFTEF